MGGNGHNAGRGFDDDRNIIDFRTLETIEEYLRLAGRGVIIEHGKPNRILF